MAKDVKNFERYVSGISDFETEGAQDSFSHGRSVDHRTSPTSFKLLPKSIKESGSIVTDLIKWGETVSGVTYMIGDSGKFYKRTGAGSYSLLRTIANNSGNGLGYFAEDDFVYYPNDKSIGRYGPIASTPAFTDDFLGAQGGVPTNLTSIDLEAGSSQYAARADTASLSITGDLSMEIWVYPESLPASGSSMALLAKWDESGTLRSYKMDYAAVSGYFGDGGDGAVTVSSSDVYDSGFATPLIDASCTATSGTPTISATNASFAADQEILIIQSRGTGAGTWERRTILSYTAGTITTTENLSATYVSGAQVLVLNEFTNFTINTSITLTAKAWDGTTGGILAFLCSGTLTVTGSINATGKGFRGASAPSATATGYIGFQGEGTAGARDTKSVSANGSGAGGGRTNDGGGSGG